MKQEKRTARLAGVLYLVVVISGIFNLMYVPSRLIDWDNLTVTVSNIRREEMLFRFGILSGLICYISFLFLSIALFQLLHRVNKTIAFVMVVLVIVSIPISLISIQHKFEILTLLDAENYSQFTGRISIETEVFLHLKSHSNGNRIASLFWGLWLLPFGILVVRSSFLPKLLGVVLMFGCLGYLANFIGFFFVNRYEEFMFSRLITIPGSVGEIGICLWLLIVGVKQKRVKIQLV